MSQYHSPCTQIDVVFPVSEMSLALTTNRQILKFSRVSG